MTRLTFFGGGIVGSLLRELGELAQVLGIGRSAVGTSYVVCFSLLEYLRVCYVRLVHRLSA